METPPEGISTSLGKKIGSLLERLPRLSPPFKKAGLAKKATGIRRRLIFW